MSIAVKRPHPFGASANRSYFEQAFIGHVLRLVQMGYDRIPQPEDYAKAQETDITGVLKCAVQRAMEDHRAPEWTLFYHVTEEEPIETATRQGKRRRRVDIEIVRSVRGPRPRFQFEAKRLHDSSSTAAYVGQDGLGCFLAGADAYARQSQSASMLGYVQTGTSAKWAKRISARLASTPSARQTAANGAWQSHQTVSGPNHTYRTAHNRPQSDPIALYHILLTFH